MVSEQEKNYYHTETRKEVIKKAVKRYQEKNKEKIKEYNDEYYKRPEVIEREKNYYKTPTGKQSVLKAIKKYEKTKKGKRRVLKERLKKYSLSIEEYDKLIEKYNSYMVCNIKWDKKIKPYIDHDHNSREVRGFLCFKCNSGIGLLGDSLLDIQKAVKYLENNWSTKEKGLKK